jgi:hypothetical protein
VKTGEEEEEEETDERRLFKRSTGIHDSKEQKKDKKAQETISVKIPKSFSESMSSRF